MFSLQSHWLDITAGVRHCPSPNFNARPAGASLDLLVIHNISLPPGEFGGPEIEQLFSNTLSPHGHPYFQSIHQLQVSAHALIRRDGDIVQFVGFNDRAWHAGQSCFAGRENCNDFSIGIELEGTDDQPYEAIQYHVLGQLILLLFKSYPTLSADNIVGHCDIAPHRKTDPGPHFDWQTLQNKIALDLMP